MSVSVPLAEDFVLLLLSDSNLPTGGFVASSGLESYVQHGFVPTTSAASKADGILAFIRKSVHAYANLNLPFLSAAHTAVSSLPTPSSPAAVDAAFAQLRSIDDLLEAQVLNHVSRRASTAQGVALLTLYERAFTVEGAANASDGPKLVVERLRLGIRQGEVHGHLPIGFAIITASLGLSLERSQLLFLFLHARSLLSSAIRLNTVGPYVSHRLLLHDVRPLVEESLLACRRLSLRGAASRDPVPITEDDEDGPATTWPLGEILAARHDQLHSKIFNS